MSFERRVRRKLDELEAMGFTEFREGETLLEWIKRMAAELPDPWASVKKLNREIQEKRIQKWVDDHRIRSSNNSMKVEE